MKNTLTILLLSISSFFVACDEQTESETTNTSDPTIAIQVTENISNQENSLVRKVKKLTVGIIGSMKYGGFTGTGFVYSVRNGTVYIATARHCVVDKFGQEISFQIILPNGKSVVPSVGGRIRYSSNPRRDAALLIFKDDSYFKEGALEKNLIDLNFSDTTYRRILGAKCPLAIVCTRYEEGQFNYLIKTAQYDGKVDQYSDQISVENLRGDEHGNSGSAIIGPSGIIGVNSAVSADDSLTGFFIPISVCDELLTEK